MLVYCRQNPDEDSITGERRLCSSDSSKWKEGRGACVWLGEAVTNGRARDLILYRVQTVIVLLVVDVDRPIIASNRSYVEQKRELAAIRNLWVMQICL